MRNMDSLWQQYKKQGDQNARQEIITSYAYLAKYVVDRLRLRPNSVIGYDDLVSHAIMGLIDAVEKFDPSKGFKFETYANVRIRGEVLDAIKSLDWTPRSVRSTEQELRRVFASLEAELGRAATDEEVAAEMEMDLDTYEDTLAEVGQSAILSLEDLMVYGEEGQSVTDIGLGSSPEYDPMFTAMLSERKRLLASAIKQLPEREMLVISLYYKDGLTLKEIAAVLGVTESRVCQLHSKAVIRLHGKLARHQDLLLVAA